MTLHISSVDTLIIYFEKSISPNILDQVQRAYRLLRPIEGVIDITPSYNSLLIQYDIMLYDYQSIQNIVRKTLVTDSKDTTIVSYSNKLIKIPTQYNTTVGIDLERVAKINNLSIEEVIELHTQTVYRVYAIGFMVGFAYLATVPQQIITPRIATPRTKVSKGSVAIAEHQTAIYPQDSAGGWNIIGHTDFNNFKSFKVGDSIQFVSLS